MRILHALASRVRRTWSLGSNSGSYRFLVRRWDRVSDIDLAVRVLGTEFFKEEFVPVPLPVTRLRSILVLAPHQDDETIGAGGSLLLASRAKVRIDVLYVTDGDFDCPPYATNRDDSVRIRNAEARCVCEQLGASMHHLNVSNQTPQPTLENLGRLIEIICQLKPQVVMAPWILDSPAKHRLVNHLLWLANRQACLPEFEIWGYQVHNTLFPNGYVDITSVAEEKRRLLECFKSQNDYYTRYDHIAMGMAAWNARILTSTIPRYVEVFFTLPFKEFLRLVEGFYFADWRATYRGHKAVLQGALALHEAVAKSKRNGHVARKGPAAMTD